MTEVLANFKEKKKPRQRFKWRKYLLFIVIVIVFLYLISLVLLNTSWAKNKLTSRLESQFNSPWTIGSTYWTPYGNIELNNLKTTMGEGGVKIKSLKTKLSWSNLLSGKIILKEATIEDAEVSIDLKWIKENTKNDTIIVPKKINQAKQPKLTPTQKPPQPKPNKNPTQQPPTQKPPQPKTPNDKKKLEKPVIKHAPTQWIKLKNFNLILKNGTEILEQIPNISASIPYAGKPTEGKIIFKFNNQEHIQKIHWSGQDLIAEENNGNAFNVNYRWQAVCKIHHPSMPFMFRFLIPNQKLNFTLNRPNLHLNISSETIATNFSLNGSLKKINTWRGIVNAATSVTTITEHQKTHKKLVFEHTRLVGTIANGVLNIPVAEAIGHKTSILTNGTIHKNLYSYGIVRLICNRDSLNFFNRIYRGSEFVNIKYSPHTLLSPLNSLERSFCDIYIDGQLNALEIRHERSDHWQLLSQTIRKLNDFKNNELQEDGLLEQ